MKKLKLKNKAYGRRGWKMGNKIKQFLLFPALLFLVVFSIGILIQGCGEKEKESKLPPAAKAEERKLPAIVITEPRFTELGTTSDAKITVAGLSVKELDSVKWENNRGGGGLANGTVNWRVPEVVLQPGENIIKISAKDSNTGEIYTSVVKVSYKPVDLLGTLTVKPATIYIDDQNEIIAEIPVTQHPKLNKNKVEIYRTYEDGKNMYILGLLTDDGNLINGDKAAGDNVWSRKFVLAKGQEGEVELKRVGQTADELSRLWGLFDKDVGQTISVRVSAYLLEDDGSFITVYSNKALMAVEKR
jgi:hypothetical protein